MSAPARFGGGSKKLTDAEKRIAAAKATATAVKPAGARRGEAQSEEQAKEADKAAPKAAEAALPHPTQSPDSGKVKEGIVHTVAEIAAVAADPFAYVPAPTDASDLDHVAHAARQILRADQAAVTAVGNVQARYTKLVGGWLKEVAERKSYKDAGHKSVEKFAASIGIDRKEYYRFIEGFAVFDAIGDMVEEPLGINTIEQLAITARQSREDVRAQFAKMKEAGRVSAASAKAVRQLLWGSENKAIERTKPEPKELPPAIDRLQAAKAEGRIDLDLLKEVASNDRDSALAYIEDMRDRLKAAEDLLK
ncbi:hypothetical protein [Streptomyces sp. NPDC059761]|uniref:hypothetical protein n=1 Tax=Streptomyces sp. NPDC059761 TaxID=3346937 RepID=UPI003651CFFD